MINSLGLLFFLPMVNLSTQRGIICSIVIINGIVCHTTRYLKTYGWEYIRNYFDNNCCTLTLSIIQSCPGTTRFGSSWTKQWIRLVTKSSQTQNSSRNEKDAQCHLEPGTPNISPRSFSGPFW